VTLAAVAVLVGIGPCASQATAATFTVDPTQIFLSERTSSVLLTLRNDSVEPLRFQLTAFAWRQSPSGEMQLEPTEDIVFFPTLLTLEAGDTRRVRVGRATPLAAQERTYRIFVEELPPLKPTGEGVRVLTKMGIPIFLRPQREVATASLENLRMEAGRFHFSLTNNGTVHFVPQEVKVAGRTDGAAAFELPLEGWYVLAGGRRDFEIAIDDAACAQVRSLVVSALVGANLVEERLQTPSGVCAP
jgi:fimbrial chaperone protein